MLYACTAPFSTIIYIVSNLLKVFSEIHKNKNKSSNNSKEKKGEYSIIILFLNYKCVHSDINVH